METNKHSCYYIIELYLQQVAKALPFAAQDSRLLHTPTKIANIFYESNIKQSFYDYCLLSCKDTLAEWLRRRPAKPMGSPRVDSTPTGVDCSNHPQPTHVSHLCLDSGIKIEI